MNTGLFAVAPRDEGVVSVRISTEEDPYIGPSWVNGLSDVLGRLAEQLSIRAVVLEGGQPYFSAGASRSALVETSGPGILPDYAARAVQAVLDVPVPIIAAAAGHAIGGGLVLAILCDAVVLGEESLYAANFMGLGFTPGMGATTLVPEAFGEFLGRELLYSGRMLTGREIRHACCPLSHAVRPRADVMDRACRVAQDFAEAPRDSLVQLKRILTARRRDSLERALQAERAAHALLLANPAMRDEIARRYPQAVIRGAAGEA